MWNEKYEPWRHLRNMGRLVGTGFYIPPEWYNHFRMFPPINNNFQEEKTLNPNNRSEPTQDGADTLSEERARLREELGQRSRSLAAEGMRYYNLFWVRKPLEDMERQYYVFKGSGMSHDAAIRKTLGEFYTRLAERRRAALIQSEEARLSGEFLSMREAATVIGALAHLQRHELTPQQVTLLAQRKRADVVEGDVLSARIERYAKKKEVTTPAPDGGGAPERPATPEEDPSQKQPTGEALLGAPAATPGDQPGPPEIEGGATSASLTFEGAVLFDELAGGTPSEGRAVVVKPNPGGDTLAKLQSRAMADTGSVEWFSASGPSYPTSGAHRK